MERRMLTGSELHSMFPLLALLISFLLLLYFTMINGLTYKILYVPNSGTVRFATNEFRKVSL